MPLMARHSEDRAAMETRAVTEHGLIRARTTLALTPFRQAIVSASLPEAHSCDRFGRKVTRNHVASITWSARPSWRMMCCYRALEMTFWLPQTEVALAQVERW